MINSLNDVSAFATAAATVGLVGVTYLLARLGQDQAKTSKAQLRAYLSVIIGNALFQDSNIKFEGLPEIRNNGQTPAYKVRTWIFARIISNAEVETFDFKAFAPTNLGESQASIGPTETRILRAFVENRVPDEDVAAIKVATGSALWVWGEVHYETFDEPHVVRFSQKLFWLSDGRTVRGQYGIRFVGSD